MFSQLGDIRFEQLFSPSQWDSEYEWNWADLPRIGAKPASQAISAGLVTHSIGLRLSSAFTDVPDAIQRLRDIGDAMLDVPYLLGNGEFISRVTFRKMSLTRQEFRPDGTLETAEVALELSEYVPTKSAKGSAVWD